MLLSHLPCNADADIVCAHAAAFYAALRTFLAICIAAAPTFALEDFVQRRCALAWRKFLTDALLAAFFANGAYYKIVHMSQIDNPDQRIAQDASRFAESSVDLLGTLLSKIFNCAAFVGAVSLFARRTLDALRISSAQHVLLCEAGTRAWDAGADMHVCSSHLTLHAPKLQYLIQHIAVQACCGKCHRALYGFYWHTQA